MNGIVFDIEADGLTPTKIHCLSANPGKIQSTTSYEDMRSFFTKSDILIGHNIIRYDIPVVERLLGITVTARLIDTLALSWYLYPSKLRHGLAWWGEDFGIEKPKIDDWDNLTVEEYVHRCEEDVKINSKLWDKQWKYLLRLYGSEEDALRLVEYLTFKMQCAADQEKHRWKLDVPRCTGLLDTLLVDRGEKLTELAAAMPLAKKMGKKTKPVKMYLKGKVNVPTVAGESWFTLLESCGLPKDFDGVVDYVKSTEEPNPGSHDQIKDWLYSLGWVPETFDCKRDKVTGDVRFIPQVQQDKSLGPGLCSSIKMLYAVEPRLMVLDGLSILTHRIGILNGFLNNVDDEGYVRAEVQGLTNTLRFKHKVIVNLPGIDKRYGSDIRGCLVAPEGYELCGSDMSSLEDRTKQHFMWPHDPEYVKEMQTPDFDPHLDLAQFAGELTKLQVAMHKAKEEDHGAVRRVYKSVNYAAVYGAGAPTIARTAGCIIGKAERLLTTYWKRNWSVKKIAEEQIVKTCMGQKWLFNPVSKLWYCLRYEKDRFSTLNQGTGVWCFDSWVKEVRRGGPPIIGQMHDEIICLVRVGIRDRVTKHLNKAMDTVNGLLQLNRDLGCSIDFGNNYGEIH